MNVRTPEDMGALMTSPPRDHAAIGRSHLPEASRTRRRSGHLRDTRWTISLREGLAGAACFVANLLVESDAGRDDTDPGRPWFPDFDEVE